MSTEPTDELQAVAVQPGDDRADDRSTVPPLTDSEWRDQAIRQRHRLVLIGVGVVVLGSLLLEVVGTDRVAIRGLTAYPLPHTCASRFLFDRGCPGCGLTRSFIHLASGRWGESLAVHRLGWLFALAFLLQIPYRVAGLLGNNPLPLGRRFPAVFGYSLVAILFGNWCYSQFV